MILIFNILGVSGGRETSEGRTGGRSNGIGEVKDLRGRGRLIDGGKLEVMRRYSEQSTQQYGYGKAWSMTHFANIVIYLIMLKTL